MDRCRRKANIFSLFTGFVVVEKATDSKDFVSGIVVCNFPVSETRCKWDRTVALLILGLSMIVTTPTVK
jgi:hypothetical protein